MPTAQIDVIEELAVQPETAVSSSASGSGQHRAVVVNKGNRKPDEALLFPGWLLQEKVRNIQHGATIVGTTTELIAESLFGWRLQGNAREEDANLFPDLYNTRTNWMMEVKACKAQGRFLLELEQLRDYEARGNCLYAFCCYSHPHPVGLKANRWASIGEVVENVAQTLTDMYVLDIRVLSAMRRFPPPGTSFRMGVQIRFPGREVMVRDYLTINQKALHALRDAPAPFLAAMNLPPSDWTLKTTKRRARFKFNDVVFSTKKFAVHELSETIPF